jgi:phage terminase large subunit-like protein
VTDRRGNAAKRVAITTPPPWRTTAWKKKSRHARAIEFQEEQCYLPKGSGHGEKIILAEFQKEFLEEALADGVDAAVLTTGRGNGKSTGGGGLAVWATFDDDSGGVPQVPIVATTVGQAIRSCYGVAVAMIKRNKALRDRSLIYTGIATPRVVVPYMDDGELFPVSNDVDGLLGLDPSLAIIDEIGFQPIESYVALKMAAGKREHNTLIGLGTKGVNTNNALEYLRRQVRERGGVEGLVYREFSTPPDYAIDDPVGWVMGNPALEKRNDRPFLRESAIAGDLAMPEGLFRIFRLNQTIEGVDCWLGPNAAAIWDGLTEIRAPQPGASTWVGVDIGIKRDSSVVDYVQRRPDGRLHTWGKAWVPTRDDPVDVTAVMGYLRQLCKLFKVEGIAYDPRFFDYPAKTLGDERLPMVEVPQSPERMTPIIGNLHDLIKGDGIRHNGDPGMRAHILNARARVNERGFTLEKSKSRGHIDHAIGVSLAADLAVRARPRRARKPRIVRGA